MKKFVAIGLSAVLGLACLGVAACGGNGEEIDPVTFVSDRISSDEDWDRAMWNTLVSLGFASDDDAAKTYPEEPYWRPRDVGDFSQGRNYKVTYWIEQGGQQSVMQYVADNGKYYAHVEGDTPGGIWPHMVGEAYGRYDEQGEWHNVERYGQDGLDGAEWGKHSDLLERSTLRILIPILDLSHLSAYPSAEQINDITGPYYMAYNPFHYYDAEQIAAGAAGGPIYYQSVFEFAKYDEEKGGYVISPILSGDEHLDYEILNYFSPVIGSVLKFKDGKLVAVTNWHPDEEDPVFDLAITYGGQKVEFPSDLPW